MSTILVIILLIIIFVLIIRAEYLNSLVSKNKERLENQQKEIATIEPILTILQHSDYGIEYLQNCFSLFNKLKGKNTSQSNKELQELAEPRIQRIYLQDRKVKLKNLIKQLDWDTLVNLELFLLFHGIKSEWNTEMECEDFYPEFSLLENFRNEENFYLDSSGNEFNHLTIPSKYSHSPILPYNSTSKFDKFPVEELYVYEEVQYIFTTYIYRKYGKMFNTMSVVSDIDEYLEEITPYEIKQRYSIAIDIKTLLDSIPLELKNSNVYIASKHSNVFDAIVFKGDKLAELPQYIKSNDSYGKLSILYLLQHIGNSIDRLNYVTNSTLNELKELLKRKRRKLLYEKETISLNGDTLTVFIIDDLYYIGGSWKTLKELQS